MYPNNQTTLTARQARDLLDTFDRPIEAEIKDQGFAAQFISNSKFMDKPYCVGGRVHGSDEIWVGWEGVHGLEDRTMGRGYTFDAADDVSNWRLVVHAVRKRLRELIIESD